MSYDPHFGHTKGIVHCHRYDQLIEPLRQAMGLEGHPMFLPVLLAGRVIEISSAQMTVHSSTLTGTIEVETGQNLYRFGKKVNRLTIKYGRLTWETNVLLTNLEWTKMKLEALPLLHHRVTVYSQENDNKIAHTQRQEIFRKDHQKLMNIVDHQQSLSSNLLMYLNNIQERAKTALEVVSRPTNLVSAASSRTTSTKTSSRSTISPNSATPPS
jgi:hypothetical protein